MTLAGRTRHCAGLNWRGVPIADPASMTAISAIVGQPWGITKKQMLHTSGQLIFIQNDWKDWSASHIFVYRMPSSLRHARFVDKISVSIKRRRTMRDSRPKLSFSAVILLKHSGFTHF